jgi:hypothetical protein
VSAPEFDDMGPIDAVLIGYPTGAPMTGEAVPYVIDLVERGIVRILDVVFIVKGDDGSLQDFPANDLDAGSVGDFAAFEGASSGLFDRGDIAAAADALESGTSGVLIVYENAWAAPFSAAVRRNGGRLVASARVGVQDLIDALEAAEASSRDGRGAAG